MAPRMVTTCWRRKRSMMHKKKFETAFKLDLKNKNAQKDAEESTTILPCGEATSRLVQRIQ